MQTDASLDLRLTSLANLPVARPPSDPGSRTVSGLVFEATPTGRQPVEGASVGWEGLSDTVLAETRSDGVGRYLLCSLPLGRTSGLFAVKQGSPTLRTHPSTLAPMPSSISRSLAGEESPRVGSRRRGNTPISASKTCFSNASIPPNTGFGVKVSGPLLINVSEACSNSFEIGVAGHDLRISGTSMCDIPELVEQIDPRTFLAISSGLGYAAVGAPPASTIAATFPGYFDYCVLNEAGGKLSVLLHHGAFGHTFTLRVEQSPADPDTSVENVLYCHAATLHSCKYRRLHAPATSLSNSRHRRADLLACRRQHPSGSCVQGQALVGHDDTPS